MFFSLHELNRAIQELLERLNDRPFRKLEGTRRSRVRGTTTGGERLEAACLRALHIQSVSFTSVKSILSNGLDGLPLPDPEASMPPPPVLKAEHVRGAEYYLTPGTAPRGLEGGSSC